jgi:hypothetical protein
VTRALLLDLDAWARQDTEPPPSRYPTIAKGELVPLERVRFPSIPSFPFTTYMPQLWKMDYGQAFATSHVITTEPPRLGAPYRVLVPQVDADGNDVGGIPLPEIAVPLGTYTGWNVTIPRLIDLHYLSGLVGGFEPLALTKAQREASGDARPSIAERYMNREDYLARVKRAADDLVQQRFMRSEDVTEVVQRAGRIWDAVTTTSR